ncbi:MAG: hypothetical protein N4A62_10845 [Marinisporobacter sp.]|nr:hypothetical protein [Marinisporobacter sp.]
MKEYTSDVFVDDCTLEYDAAIDEENNVYFAYQRKDGNLVLMSLENGFWHENILGGDHTLNILNLNLFIYKQKVHMIYCIPANESDMCYRIYHHYYNDQEWKTFVVQDIKRKNLLNSFQIIQREETFVLGFYDFLKEHEQIYIKEFDLENEQWKNAIEVTSSPNDKLYLDMFMGKNRILHVTYSEYFQGNLVVKYEKYKFENGKAKRLIEKILSNPSNCSYATFVKQDEKLWVIWTEYEQVVSCFTKDNGKTWSELYLWKESKTIDFFRYKFNTNAQEIKAGYELNYTFGRGYPEFSFIGFGPLENVDRIPLKMESNKKLEDMTRKKKVNDKEIKTKEIKSKEKENKRGNILEKEWRVLEKRIKVLEEKLNHAEKIDEKFKIIEALGNQIETMEEKLKRFEEVEETVKHMDEYLKRKRRGLFR